MAIEDWPVTVTPFHPSMKNLWDVAPLPVEGDPDITDLAAAKGVTTSEWEMMEVHLGDLYASLLGHKPRTREAYAQYSQPANFRSRIEGLEELASQYFKRNCNQVFEGMFHTISTHSRGFSSRRNEIVHSLIHPLMMMRPSPYTDSLFMHQAYFLVPPWYHDRKYDESNRPSFLYTSNELQYYTEMFRLVGTFCQSLSQRIFDRRSPSQ